MDIKKTAKSQHNNVGIAVSGVLIMLLAVITCSDSPSSPALVVGGLGGFCGLACGVLGLRDATLKLRKYCRCYVVVEIGYRRAYYLDTRDLDEIFDVQPAFFRVDRPILFLPKETRDYPAELNLSWPLEDGRKMIANIRRSSDIPADVFEKMHGQKLNLERLRQKLLDWNRDHPVRTGAVKERFRVWAGGAYEMTEFIIKGKAQRSA